jgi:Fe-S-cluster containining protein
MGIERKVKLVEQLFDRLDGELIGFQSKTGLRCVSGCGKCCTTPHIDASPLEFLPWAFHLYLNGQAEIVLDELNQTSKKLCHIYRPVSIVDSDNGSCSNYKYRGLICRLFGYAASRDNLGKLRLATCKIIKENQSENYKNTTVAIANGLYVPIFSDYYMHLSQIDFRLGKTMLPINEALKTAIEEVLHYYAYRPFPGGLKVTA